jgi:nucleotide-binding universal stress UspA family protein
MPPPYDSVLCPTDLTPTGNLAVAMAYAVVATSGTVHLLHVVAPTEPAAAPDVTAVHRDRLAHAALWRLVPEVAAARDVHTQVHTISRGAPTDEILIEAALRQADVIVMSAARADALGATSPDSIAAAVMRSALVPVILAPVLRPD